MRTKLTRLLPPTWVRYQVHMGEPYRLETLTGADWLVPVTITEPRWMRALMEPLREYLGIQVRLVGGERLSGSWVLGDVRSIRLLADGTTTVDTVLAEQDTGGFKIGDNPKNGYHIEDGRYEVELSVTRSVDRTVAAQGKFYIVKRGTDLVCGSISGLNTGSIPNS